MKNVLIIGVAVILLSCISGCYRYMAVHPEKSDTQIYEDSQICEKKVRGRSMEMREEWDASSELVQIRKCMRDKGYIYRFRMQ